MASPWATLLRGSAAHAVRLSFFHLLPAARFAGALYGVSPAAITL
jgi:hypothetical protein